MYRIVCDYGNGRKVPATLPPFHTEQEANTYASDLNEKVSMITHGDDVPLFVYRVEECKEGEIDERAD